MRANVELDHASRTNDLARLSLKVAAEFDKVPRRKTPRADVARDFAERLRLGGDVVTAAEPAFLHNHSAIGALSRAWRRAYPDGTATVASFRQEVRETVADAERLLASDLPDGREARERMKKFFIALHRELVEQQYPARRPRRAPHQS